QTGLGVESVTRIAARFAEVAGQTSFNVDDLGTVINGVLPSFQSIAGTGFDEVLELASVAAARLGTNASRVRTALRQIPRFMVQFREEIERLTGVQIADERGNIVGGIDSIITALKKMNELQGTVAGFSIADAFAE